MSGITAAAVNSFLVGRGPATRSWHDTYYALKGLFRFAVSRGHLAVRCCGLTDHSACSGIARRSDDTEARHCQDEQATARERPQAGSCRPAMMDVINLAGELRHSIETGDQIHACLALNALLALNATRAPRSARVINPYIPSSPI